MKYLYNGALKKDREGFVTVASWKKFYALPLSIRRRILKGRK